MRLLDTRRPRRLRAPEPFPLRRPGIARVAIEGVSQRHEVAAKHQGHALPSEEAFNMDEPHPNDTLESVS